MLDYLVVYDTETGNTKKIATEIFSTLPGMSKDLINLNEREQLPEANVYFIGFCVHRGTCSIAVGNLLSGLSGKSVALFGTCGTGNHPEYYKKIAGSVRIWLEDDNNYLGSFICQGKMPLAIRQKYESMFKDSSGCDCEKIQRQLLNFDEAMIHPDRSDLAHAADFTRECINKIEK